MRVAHVVRQFAPAVGGLEDAVLSIAREQRRELGLDAQVITLNRVFGRPERLPRHDVVEGVPVLRLPWSGSRRYPLAPSVLAHLRSVDLIHVHAIDFFFDFLALTRFLHQRPMVVSTHGGFFHSAALSRIKRLWFATVTRASILGYRRVIACSHSDAALFQRVARDRLVVIENGINQAKFADASSKAPSRTMISFGRFARHKRLDALFPLLAALRALDTSWRLIVAGRDADQTHDQLRQMAVSSGVDASVSFVVDPTDADLRSLLGQAGYFVCLSQYEGFGLAAVEALSAGLFPILSDIEPFRRLISTSGLGLLVDPDQPDAAAAVIAASGLADPERHAERRAACVRASWPYDWKAVAVACGNLYAEVLETPSSGPAYPVEVAS